MNYYAERRAEILGNRQRRYKGRKAVERHRERVATEKREEAMRAAFTRLSRVFGA